MSELNLNESTQTIEPVELEADIISGDTEKIPSGIFMIFKKTFTDLFSVKRFAPYVLLSILFPFIFSIAVAGNFAVPISSFNLSYQISIIVSYFSFYSFFWNAGILLWMFGGLSASVFISGEENSGTMVFLLTKPIKRTNIFFGKFFGYLANMLILQLISLFLGLTITCTIFQSSFRVFIYSLYYLIPIYIFAILMIVVVGLIFGFLSIINKKVIVSVLILMLAVILIYFLGIIFRIAIPDFYEQFRLYIMDLGYNLSIIYTAILDLFGFEPTPFFQQYFGLFFGTYVNQFTDIATFLNATDPDQGLTILLPETNYISPVYSVTVMLVISIILLVIGLIVLRKKDVGG